MSVLVLGRKITVSMFVIDGFYPMLCAKGGRFISDMDTIEVTSVNSPNAREYKAGLQNARLSVNGITTTNNSNGKLSPFYLLQQSVRRSIQQFRMAFQDQDGNIIGISFNGLIKTIAIEKDILQWSQSAIDIQISGGITIEDPVTPPVVSEFEILSDWWPVVAGNDFVATGSVPSGEYGLTLEATDEMLEIGRSGTTFDIVTGTPGNLQARFNTSNQRVEFEPNPASPFNSGETIFVMFKRPV